ncbi:MAG: hypothetical protein HWN68_14910 [Desulfobacterales bacterium]|nr:hypothetical protein [Desulfobacterales bacterium]
MESSYWKEFLAETASDLHRVARPKRLTQRRYEIVERNIVIGFFLLRRLIELHKVSSRVRDFRLKVFAWPSTGKLPTLLNNHREELYEFSKEHAQTKKPMYICNQVIHSYSIAMVVDKTRNWDSLLTVSDYDRKDCIWRIPVDVIVDLLRTASTDYPYQAKYTRNEKTGDYDVETN